MSESDVDDFLEHVGVKGMKWGQRKAEGAASAVGSAVGSAAKGAAGSVGSAAKGAGSSIKKMHAESKAVTNQQKAVRQTIKAESKKRIAAADAEIAARDKARYTKSDGTTATGRKVVDTILGGRVALIKIDTINQAGYTGGKAAAINLFRSPAGVRRLRNKNIKAQVRQEQGPQYKFTQ